MSITPRSPSMAEGERFEHGSVLGGKTRAAGSALSGNQHYKVERIGCGLIGVNLNGADLPFTRRANPYRRGPAEISIEVVMGRIAAGVNRLSMRIG
jgi:hypothetical protein